MKNHSSGILIIIAAFLLLLLFGVLLGHAETSTWDVQIADSTGGAQTSIALDSGRNPHISYRDTTNGDLKYAKLSGLDWNTQTVDASAGGEGYTSIALDSGETHT